MAQATSWGIMIVLGPMEGFVPAFFMKINRLMFLCEARS